MACHMLLRLMLLMLLIRAKGNHVWLLIKTMLKLMLLTRLLHVRDLLLSRLLSS